MIWVLVSWHLDCCPLDLNFVSRAKPKSSRTSSISPLSVLSSQLLSSLFTRQQLCPWAMSLHSRLLLCCLTPHNYCEDDAVYMRVVALLALNLGSGLFFKTENIGQSLMSLWMSETIYHCESCNSSTMSLFSYRRTYRHPNTFIFTPP